MSSIMAVMADGICRDELGGNQIGNARKAASAFRMFFEKRGLFTDSAQKEPNSLRSVHNDRIIIKL